jgi:hypothetical protein
MIIRSQKARKKIVNLSTNNVGELAELKKVKMQGFIILQERIQKKSQE